MPDPTLSDVTGGMRWAVWAPTRCLRWPMLPGAMGSLGGLGGAAQAPRRVGWAGRGSEPLAGLASGLGDQAATTPLIQPTRPTTKSIRTATRSIPRPTKTTSTRARRTTTTGCVPAEHQHRQSAGRTARFASHHSGGRPPGRGRATGARITTVKLPDGSTASARTPAAAQAVRDYLAGGTVDTAYHQNGMTLPPVGTPITAPVDPTRLTCGDVAMFKDHYEPISAR